MENMRDVGKDESSRIFRVRLGISHFPPSARDPGEYTQVAARGERIDGLLGSRSCPSCARRPGDRPDSSPKACLARISDSSAIPGLSAPGPRFRLMDPRMGSRASGTFYPRSWPPAKTSRHGGMRIMVADLGLDGDRNPSLRKISGLLTLALSHLQCGLTSQSAIERGLDERSRRETKPPLQR